jgi:hypothetical protein
MNDSHGQSSQRITGNVLLAAVFALVLGDVVESS